MFEDHDGPLTKDLVCGDCQGGFSKTEKGLIATGKAKCFCWPCCYVKELNIDQPLFSKEEIKKKLLTTHRWDVSLFRKSEIFCISRDWQGEEEIISQWKIERVAQTACLENRFSSNVDVSSNLTFSSKFKGKPK